MNTAIICLCSEEYLGYYDVLYNSIKTHCKDITPVLYYLGENMPKKNYGLVGKVRSWYENANPDYNNLEKICSLRAKAVLEAFSMGFTEVIFSGAKVEFFAYPEALIEPLGFNGGQNAVVTPHILEPLPEDGFFPSNASISFTGHISTDVVSFRNCPEIIKFLEWQDNIMQNNCKTTNKTYLDQSWLNFLPFFVDNVKILRDPRYNIAYWNKEQRNDIWDQKVCYQYSGLDLNDPRTISTHQNRHDAEPEFLVFLEDYAKRVKNY